MMTAGFLRDAATRRVIAVASLMVFALLSACNSNPPKPAAETKPEVKAPETLTGRAAFYKTFIAARNYAADVKPFRIESTPTTEDNGQDGKATIWRASYASAMQRGVKPFIWSGSNLPDAPSRGVSPGNEDVYNPSNASTQVFDPAFLKIGRDHTVARMAPHLSHTGVHDHGFNNVSTYGNLRRLVREHRIPADRWELNYYELALKISGAVQAARWTPRANGGFIYSFNGPQSLFVDTIRSCRALVLSHSLGHSLCGEGDRRINLLERALNHIRATAEFSVFYGESRDSYDIRGRVAHECLFNVNDGAYRPPVGGYCVNTRFIQVSRCPSERLHRPSMK